MVELPTTVVTGVAEVNEVTDEEVRSSVKTPFLSCSCNVAEGEADAGRLEDQPKIMGTLFKGLAGPGKVKAIAVASVDNWAMIKKWEMGNREREGRTHDRVSQGQVSDLRWIGECGGHVVRSCITLRERDCPVRVRPYNDHLGISHVGSESSIKRHKLFVPI